MLKEWYAKLSKSSNNGSLHLYQTSDLEKYDAIVVGAGPAGATAAYFMSKKGLKVLLVERSTYPGTKVCGGASLIAEHTHKLFPNFWEELNWERVVSSQAYWWMTEDSVVKAEFKSLRFLSSPYNRFTVKRTNLYKWLIDKALECQTTLLLGHTVTKLLFDGNKVCGIYIASPEKKYIANVVIIADGANSLLAEQSNLIPRQSAQNLSLYVKETIRLSTQQIENGFNLTKNQGSIIGLIGFPTAGFNGTASIHTFKDSLNINVGMPVSDYVKSGIAPVDLLQRIKKHPFISPLLKAGISIEYGASLIPEGGYFVIPKLVHEGLMIIGDAAGLVNGTHGINLAMWSGYFAAQSTIIAKQKSNYSKQQLSVYSHLLNNSFVMKDLKANKGAAKLQKDIPYLFDLYSKLANEAAYYSSKVYTMPKKEKRKLIYKKLTSIQPLYKVVADGLKVLRVILGG